MKQDYQVTYKINEIASNGGFYEHTLKVNIIKANNKLEAINRLIEEKAYESLAKMEHNTKGRTFKLHDVNNKIELSKIIEVEIIK